MRASAELGVVVDHVEDISNVLTHLPSDTCCLSTASIVQMRHAGLREISHRVICICNAEAEFTCLIQEHRREAKASSVTITEWQCWRHARSDQGGVSGPHARSNQGGFSAPHSDASPAFCSRGEHLQAHAWLPDAWLCMPSFLSRVYALFPKASSVAQPSSGVGHTCEG